MSIQGSQIAKDGLPSGTQHHVDRVHALHHLILLQKGPKLLVVGIIGEHFSAVVIDFLHQTVAFFFDWFEDGKLSFGIPNLDSGSTQGVDCSSEGLFGHLEFFCEIHHYKQGFVVGLMRILEHKAPEVDMVGVVGQVIINYCRFACLLYQLIYLVFALVGGQFRRV